MDVYDVCIIYIMVYHIILYIISYIILYITLHYIILYYITLYYIILYHVLDIILYTNKSEDVYQLSCEYKSAVQFGTPET